MPFPRGIHRELWRPTLHSQTAAYDFECCDELMPPVPLVLLCLALCATALAHEGSAPQAASRAVRLAAQQVAHWRAALDPHGSVYYWSNLTRQSQWAPPGTQRGVGDGAPPARLVARGSGFAVIDGLLGAHAAAHVARDVDKIHRAGLLSAKQASRDCGNFGRILDTFAAAQELLGPDMRGLAPSLASHDLVHALLVLGGTAGTGELLPSLVAEDAAPLSLEATFMMVARYRGDGARRGCWWQQPWFFASCLLSMHGRHAIRRAQRQRH